MRIINEDIKVNGVFVAKELDGEPSESLAESIKEAAVLSLAPEFSALRQENAELRQELAQKIKTLETKYSAAVERFNAAVEEVNRMSERLAALEAGYDPTII